MAAKKGTPSAQHPAERRLEPVHVPRQGNRRVGWGTSDGAQALALLKRFGSVIVLNGAHSSGGAEG
jgi:hypothetical protein